MSNSHNKAVVHRLHREVWSEGNLELVAEIVADDYVEHNPTVPHEARGPTDYKHSVELFRTAFPDLTVTTEELVVAGDTVVNHWTITGTHDGSMMGIDPTGKHVEFSGISIGTFEEGTVIEGETVVDMFGLIRIAVVQYRIDRSRACGRPGT